MNVSKGSFTKSTTTGTQAITGVGFQPKAILLWSTGGTADNAWRTSIRESFGMTDGTTSRCTSGGADAGSSSNSRSSRVNSTLLAFVTGARVLESEASLTSLDPGGFTINWGTNTAGTSYLVHFLALGGADLSAKVLAWNSRTSAGTQAITGAGFQPQILINAWVHLLTTDASTQNGNYCGLGVAGDPATQGQWSVQTSAASGIATAYQQARNDSCILETSNGNGTILGRAALTSLDADGFTLNWALANATAARAATLCLRGGINAVAAGTKATSTGVPVSQSLAAGTTYAPQAALLASVPTAWNTTNGSSGANLAIGGATATASGYSYRNESGSTVAANALDRTGKVLGGNTGQTQALAWEAGLASFGPGSVNLSWSTQSDTTASALGVLALAGVAVSQWPGSMLCHL